MVYRMVIRSKSKGLGNPVWYTISLIAFFAEIHLLQIVAVFTGGAFFKREYRETFFITYVVLYFLLCLILSTIYTRKRLARWYVARKNDPIMKYRLLISYGYLFFNMALWLILAAYPVIVRK